MRRKRKTPIFTAIVLRVLELRFDDILRIQLVSQTQFDLTIKSKANLNQLTMQFDAYMVHLVSEFGEPDQVYTFSFFQNTRLKVELKYNDAIFDVCAQGIH